MLHMMRSWKVVQICEIPNFSVSPKTALFANQYQFLSILNSQESGQLFRTIPKAVITWQYR